jgi:hypothetical protein
MRPEISEFSYGYAITDELIHWYQTALTAAPIFPSLYQEGQTGGGYDVLLQRPGIPLFLQFKLADCMIRNSAFEVKKGYLNTPFYRMPIRSTRHYNQHRMLIDLEKEGNEVYYTAPAFHLLEEFNRAYLNHQVSLRSLWIRPSTIGIIADDKEHHVAFQQPGPYFILSAPRKLEIKGNFNEFTTQIMTAFKRWSTTALSDEGLQKLAETLQRISAKNGKVFNGMINYSENKIKGRHPLERIAFYSYLFFDCYLFVVQEKKNG